MAKSKQFKITLVIFLLAASMRFLGIGSFMTADEPNWMVRSAEFWHNLARGDIGGTFRTSHPGVITMWFSGVGIVVQEARLGYNIDQSNLHDFRLAATFPLAVATAFMVAVVTWLLLDMVSFPAAFAAGFLLAIDPYLTGMSQIVHLDALLGLFMVASVLALWRFFQTRRLLYLFLTGGLAGLAMLNKLLPALWLVPVFGVLLLLYQTGSWKQRAEKIFRYAMILFGTAALTAGLLWPSLWYPGFTYNKYIRQDAVSIASQQYIDLSASSEPIEPASFYARTLLGRATPFNLILAVAVVAMAARSWRRQQLPLILFLYAVSFGLFVTMVAKKADRYGLPFLTPVPILAGSALGWLWNAVVARIGMGKRIWLLAGASFLGLLVLAQTILTVPYAIAYNNPFFPNIRHLSQQGWGEGLDAAAAWLNERPQASELTIASWYPAVMGSYFHGKTMSLSSRNDHRVAYIVTYRNMGARDSDDIATSVLEEMAGKKPVYQVFIAGVPYVSVYETVALTYYRASVGEILPGMEVGQTVPVAEDNWDRLDLGLATFNGRHNTSDLTLHIKESADAEIDLRTVTSSAAEFKDSEWNTFRFEPLATTAGKTFYISLTSANATPGNAVSIHFSNLDLRPGQMLLRRQALVSGQTNSKFLRGGDLAYRIE